MKGEMRQELFPQPDRERTGYEAGLRADARRAGQLHAEGFRTQTSVPLSVWQRQVESLPVATDRSPVPQNTDGTFKFVLGIDPIGIEPISD